MFEMMEGYVNDDIANAHGAFFANIKDAVTNDTQIEDIVCIDLRGVNDVVASRCC